MKAARLFALLAALLAAPVTGMAVETAATPMALPADWYPESIAAAADGSFYVGSWRQGAVARVRQGAARDRALRPSLAGDLSLIQNLMRALR